MEPIGRIVGGMGDPRQPRKETSESSRRTSELMGRVEVIRRQIVSFYLAARREQPEPETVDIEVSLAMTDWEEIPTHEIERVCAEARKQSGDFVPGNGVVSRVWREMKESARADAMKSIRMENTARYLAPPSEVATPEERAGMAKAAAEIAAKLSGE